MSTLDDWVEEAATALGITGAVDVQVLLDLARDVAHSVARPAAPVTAYLLGLAVGAGADLEQSVALLTGMAREWPPP